MNFKDELHRKNYNIKRLLSKISKSDNLSCWEWQGATLYGYGIFFYNGKNYRAHRISYLLFIGHFNQDEHVLHKCDNRKCVNPLHLFLGNHKINQADKVLKNRQAKGIRHGRAKLTVDQVLSIRKDKRQFSVIAKEYNMNPSTISDIIRLKIWKSIN